MTTYPGGVFSKSIAHGRAGAQLRVSSERLLAELGDGQYLEMATRDCRLDVGGASGRMWFCKSEDGALTLYSEAPGFPMALARVPALSDQVQRLQRQLADRQRTRVRLFVVFVVLLAAVVSLGYWALAAGGRAALMSVPMSVDEKIGELAASGMNLGGPRVSTAAIVDPVQAIVARLDKYDGAEVSYHVQVVEAPVTNAFALPGGHIVVYTGLLRDAPSAEAVAAVLAHEMSHVTRRHGLQSVARSVGLMATAQLLVGDVAGLSALLLELVQQGALTTFSRDHEREADQDGMRTLQRAGIDPHAMADLFKMLQEHDVEIPGMSWLSSHPDLSERIADVEAFCKEHPTHSTTPLTVNWPALQGALGASLKDSQGAGNNSDGAEARGTASARDEQGAAVVDDRRADEHED